MRQMFSILRLTAALVVISAALLAAGVGSARANFCIETVNPSGGPAVGDNGDGGLIDGFVDPFGGDAVPGGKSTSPGTNGNGPVNSDGFYLVYGYLFSDTTPIPVPEALGGGFHWPIVAIKYTEWSNNKGVLVSTFSGQNSVVNWQIQAPGDLYVNAPKGSAGSKSCLVPPPPF